MNEIIVADLWAAEAYLSAFEARETKMLDMLDAGVKIHNWMLDRTAEKYSSEVTEFNYNYKKAKQTIHALNYGVEEATMSRESGLPRFICAWQRMFYYSEFPGIQQRQESIKIEIKTTKTLTSLLGRRRYFVMPMGKDLLNIAYAWKTQSAIGELTNIALNRLRAMSHIKRLQPYAKEKYPMAERMPDIRLALNTHDGFGLFSKVEERELVYKAVAIAFYHRFKFPNEDRDVVIPVSITHGPNFNDQQEETVIRYNELKPEGLAW